MCADDTVTCGQRLIEMIRLTVRHASHVELVEVSVGPAKDGLNHIVNQLLAAHEKTETLAVTGTGERKDLDVGLGQRIQGARHDVGPGQRGVRWLE